MDTTIQFLGAAKNVTGSRYLLETKGLSLLIDCGYYQEREFRERNWAPFTFNVGKLDAVLLTHAHLDHCGLLPKLVKEGFRGRIYCTHATAEIVKIVLLDSAHIQQEDAEHKRARHARSGKKAKFDIKPLYTTEDAERCFPLFSPIGYEESVQIRGDVEVSFHDAGHILGSSMIRINIDSETIVFSGDIGRWDKPILRDPTCFEKADYVVMESTYGDRIHEDNGSINNLLAEVIIATRKRGGNILIPSFAIGRTQEVLYRLDRLLIEDRIPHLQTFVDSPMAVSVTDVFKRHPELFDAEASKMLSNDLSPFEMSNLRMVRSVAESKSINHITGTAIIIAASGMCTGGRIKHHLARNIGRSRSTILFVGYQAVGTLGRDIVEGNKEVRILGAYRKVKAKVAQIHGFSAHADQNELLKWLTPVLENEGSNRLKHVFVTHGEPKAAQAFKQILEQHTNAGITVPNFREKTVLE